MQFAIVVVGWPFYPSSPLRTADIDAKINSWFAIFDIG